MARTRKLPKLLVVFLALVAIVVLGPPALGLVVGMLALAVGLAAVALKVGLIVLGVMLAVALLRALFGGPAEATASRPVRDDLEPVDDSRRALDEELERAVAASKQS